MKLPCACGGIVEARRDKPGAGVRAHNRSDVHQEWRRERDRRPTDGALTVDKLREWGLAPGHREV